MERAIYVGSFDPFTKGHLDIFIQASNLFDKIYIVIADNSHKKRSGTVLDMKIAIHDILLNVYACDFEVVSTDMLISDVAKAWNVNYLIRGLRNPNDYSYEENIAKINKELNPELNTIYFRANNEVISSTMVKELYKYGKDISKYVDQQVLEIMKNG